MIFPPIISLSILALTITVLVILINRIFVDSKAMAELKSKMEQMREELLREQKEGNAEKASKIVNDMTATNLNYMKHTTKALIISIIVIIMILPWMQKTYSDVTVAKLPLAIPYIGSDLNWVVWYFVVSLTIGWIIRKLMGLDYA
jgi:uncharacterized membrane protein (DUF106 family)